MRYAAFLIVALASSFLGCASYSAHMDDLRNKIYDTITIDSNYVRYASWHHETRSGPVLYHKEIYPYFSWSCRWATATTLGISEERVTFEESRETCERFANYDQEGRQLSLHIFKDSIRQIHDGLILFVSPLHHGMVSAEVYLSNNQESYDSIVESNYLGILYLFIVNEYEIEKFTSFIVEYE